MLFRSAPAFATYRAYPDGGAGMANTPKYDVIITITLERLRKRGDEALLRYYEKVFPPLNELLYMRTGFTVM